MSRLLPAVSQRLFLLEALQALARTTTTAKTTVASSLMEDCLVALALEEMCHIVKTHGQVGYRQQSSVIDQALKALERQLYHWTSGQWSPYWQRVRETLKQPALQLETLQARLITPLRTEPPPERQRVETDVAVPFELLHLPEIETLVAVPVPESCYIDLERVQAQEGWRVSGAFYPFEVQVRELTFVVTAAGEIVVSIRNFPESLVGQARETLSAVAQTLYTVSPPPFTATIPEPEGGGDFPFVDEVE